MPYGSSDWQDAGNAAASMGPSLGMMPIRGAQLQLQRQRLAMQQQAMREQIMLRQAQEQRDYAGARQADATAGFETSRAGHQGLVDSTAQELGKATYQKMNPNPMSQGPTLQAQDQMLGAHQQAMMAQSGALAGNPQRGFPSVTVSPGQERISPVTGDVLGYLPPNPVARFAPAGSTPFMQQGNDLQQAGPQTGFRPDSTRLGGSADRMKNTAIPIIEMGMHDKSIQNPSSPLYGLWQGATNVAALADRAMSQQMGQTNQTKQLDPLTARQYLQRSGGDKDSARQAAKNDGYSF